MKYCEIATKRRSRKVEKEEKEEEVKCDEKLVGDKEMRVGMSREEKEKGKEMNLAYPTYYTNTLCDDNLIPRDVPSECADK